jgi:endonuclease YncB( thermonuclease family)
MKLFSFIAFFFLIICPRVSASEAINENHVYNWKVIRIVDGDTLEIANQFLPEELKLFVRIKGIDTPEKAPRAKCEKENILAQKASNYTKNSIEKAQKNRQKITFSEIKWDKYGGRIVAKVMIDENDLGQELVRKKLARVYNGEKKKSWCNTISTLK